MVPFGLKPVSIGPAAEYKSIVSLYGRLRPARFQLNNELASRLSRDILYDGAKKIGVFRKGKIVLDNEDDMSVLMDYCIHEIRRSNRNAVEQYLCDCSPDPDSDEMLLLRAMQHATYAVVAVLRVERGVGCHVRNLFTGETRLLVDFGFAKSAMPGAVFATRLLDFDTFVTTSGAAIPVGIVDMDDVDGLQRRLPQTPKGPHFDPAPLIRKLLKSGLMSKVRYEGPEEDTMAEREAKPLPDAALLLGSIGASQHCSPSKPSENRRCHCRSGKMFKNCCGKRKANS